jgi:vesicle coat complex subunit
LLRRYPERADECIAAVSGVSPADITEPEARAAFVWLLGEHGKGVQDAPYLLEAVADNFEGETPFVKLTILSSCMKLFFQRPPECQRLLGCVLKAGLSDKDQVANCSESLDFALDWLPVLGCTHPRVS